MRVHWFCIVTFAATLFSISSNASTDGMRCGQRLISTGDTLYAVRNVCGEPSASDRRVVQRTGKRRVSGPCFKDRDGAVRCDRVEEYTVEIVIDEWTYDFGPRRFVHYLTFEDGKLIKVATGGYGSADVP
jgi:uncharacterized protein DUF2845